MEGILQKTMYSLIVLDKSNSSLTIPPYEISFSEYRNWGTESASTLLIFLHIT